MTERSSPAFQFYADDFLSGTLDMTVEEVGVYIRLLAYSWSKGPITDVSRLTWIGASSETINQVLLIKFSETDEGWINERLESVRQKQADRRSAGRSGGKATQAKPQAKLKQTAKQNSTSGSSKAQANSQAKGEAKLKPPSPPPSPRNPPPPVSESSNLNLGDERSHQTERTSSGLAAGSFEISEIENLLATCKLARAKPVARELLDSGVTLDQVRDAVQTYLANESAFDGPGAIVSFFRDGCWPCNDVLSPVEAKSVQQKKDDKRRVQQMQNLMTDIIKAGRKNNLDDDQIKVKLAEKLPADFLASEDWGGG